MDAAPLLSEQMNWAQSCRQMDSKDHLDLRALGVARGPLQCWVGDREAPTSVACGSRWSGFHRPWQIYDNTPVTCASRLHFPALGVADTTRVSSTPTRAG